MQSVDMSGINAFDRTLEEILNEFPEERRALHEDFSLLLKSEVDAAVSSSGINDSHGTVRRWQVKYIGSKGGYAAIRAMGSNEGALTGPNGPGAITNYLEGGHNIRTPESSKGYRPRIRVAYVNGYHFYQSAGTGIEAKAISMAESFAGKLESKIEGGAS